MFFPKDIGPNAGEPQKGVINMRYFQLILACNFLIHIFVAGRVLLLCRVGIGDKSRVRRTTDKIVQAFLFSYRATPNPTSHGGVSAAKALMGSKLPTAFHALVATGVQPAQASSVSRSKFSVETPVFIRDYRTGFLDWIEATVVAHRGSMLFDVDVGDDISARHHNQI
ncbi:hypothetical protein SprV_0501825900 [Sparganum proliferum]